MAKNRPDECTDEMLDYLDDLRESGVTNMYGAGRYLDEAFPELAASHGGGFGSSQASKNVLKYWMDTFSERHARSTQ